MEEFRESLVVLISVPIYAVVIGFEFFYSYFNKKGLYSSRGLLSNVYLTILNMGLDILVRGVCLFILDFAYQYHVVDLAFLPFFYWIALVIFEDFMFYWLHRVDHVCRLFWAIHVTHHNSEEFNLTVGFRSSVFQPLYRFIYFIPLAFCGFKAMDIMLVYSATQIFGILVHTQTIGKLGFLEHLIVTPSHHRVHHASNVRYLDKNMGMFLIIWDKLFGTFEAESDEESVRYGLTTNINTFNPLTMVFHEWKQIAMDVRQRDITWRERFKYVFGPPGYSHDGSRQTSKALQELEKQNTKSAV